MFISEAFDFEAPPEVVFSTLTDPERADRWAPPGVRVAWLDRDRVRVSFGNSGTVYQTRRPDGAMVVEWRRSGQPDLHGTVTVEDGPAGGSVLRLDATVPDGANAGRIRELVSGAVDQLRGDVADEVSPG
ncbi:SRPBCC family protein [Luedemannella helvata]|uniref:Polyketide cyclase n=1 Tax=Luedemannella helvata TaxID=349315 RepID=A0ABP4WUP3_9ACTN